MVEISVMKEPLEKHDLNFKRLSDLVLTVYCLKNGDKNDIELSQTSNMEHFVKIVNGLKLLDKVLNTFLCEAYSYVSNK